MHMPDVARLSSIEAKLDALISSKTETNGKAAQEKPPTQEEKDEERLKELAGIIKELLDLLAQGVSRQSADEEVERLRQRVASGEDEDRPLLRVYHSHSAGKVPTTRRTQSKLMLAEALERRARVWSHPRDLEHALHIHAHEKLEIMERRHAAVGQKRVRG